MYNTIVEIDLEPVGTPMVLVTVGQLTQQEIIKKTVSRRFEETLPATNLKITVELLNKSDTDPDTAVIIKAIRLNGISHPKFAWAGMYHPYYPAEWAKNQKDLKLQLPGQTYLGWNGVYELEITVPVFTWIHQTLNLGWVFE